MLLPQRLWRWLLPSLLLQLGLALPTSFAGAPELVQAMVQGRSVVGLAIIREPNRCIMLGTDGSLLDFDPSQNENRIENLTGDFRPMDMATLRHRLQQEFGSEFEVKAAGRFLVVQPRGTQEKWAEQFDQLHRTFTQYFSVRGVRVLEGNFPQVAIVYPDQATFIARVRPIRPIVNPDLLGLYDQASNRVYMYAQAGNNREFAATIRHEAAHQSAFNSGIHSRVAPTPHWLVEGIGSLFQATAMAAGNRRSTTMDRCDAELLAGFRETYHNQDAQLLADLQSLIEEDLLFKEREATRRAYLASWALTFYLAERRPQQFSQLVEHYSQLAPFREYRRRDRQTDFTRIVGPVDQQLLNQLIRFLDQF